MDPLYNGEKTKETSPLLTVSKEHRQLAKALNFGLLYGKGAKGLAEYAKRNYGKVYKDIRSWQKQTGRVVEITHKVRTPCGRERDFSRETNGYRYTGTLNHPIQGAAAEITLYAITRISVLLSEDCRLVNVIHDEILLEVREDLAKDYAERAKTIMEQAFLEVFPNARPYIKGLVEAKIGKNWAETK